MAEKDAGAKFVSIACKVGVAWIDLQLCQEITIMENTQTGPRQVKQFAKVGDIVRIRGTAYPRGEAPEGFPERPEMVAGYAITRNVSKDFWDAWSKQHAKAEYVKSGMIVAYVSNDDVKAHAKDHVEILSGLEPIHRTKDEVSDPRIPKPTNGMVAAIEPGKAAA